jgi:hypothetical protein
VAVAVKMGEANHGRPPGGQLPPNVSSGLTERKLRCYLSPRANEVGPPACDIVEWNVP